MVSLLRTRRRIMAVSARRKSPAPSSSSRRCTPNYPLSTSTTILPLLIIALQTSLLIRPSHSLVSNYLPISYTITLPGEECLYERISEPKEHLTASVFVLSGEELRSAVVFEGPIAPVDLVLGADANQKTHSKGGGSELANYVRRYDNEGTKMFVNGKFGDSMMNVKPVRIAEMVDFEEEEEDYMDDYEMNDRERENFNAHHDLEHQHAGLERPPLPHDHPGPGHPDRRRPPPPRDYPDHRHPDDRRPDREEGGEGNYLGEERHLGEEDSEDPAFGDDDFLRYREEARREMLEREAMLDDDFVKLQLESNRNKRAQEEKDAKMGIPPGSTPERRRIVVDEPPKVEGGREGAGGSAELPKPKEEEHHRRLQEVTQTAGNHRRLRDEMRLLAGEPWQHTVQVESPGWYRLCVHPKSGTIEVEMELRKSSLYGKVDPRTGHIPSLEESEIHSEIRHLFEEENDEQVLAEEGGIKDEDLHATKEQLRLLEKTYRDIISKQMEERRVWKWRTAKNQHLYSHLVLGNLVETIVYMGITGWQVYTIRKWFGGGPALGR